MPEIKINELTTQKDKVFFPGTAVLSDRDSESFKKAQAEAKETDVADNEVAGVSKPAKDK